MIINIFSLLPNAINSLNLWTQSLILWWYDGCKNRIEILSPQFCFKWITLSTGLFGVYAARLDLSGKGTLRVSCFRITPITSRLWLSYLPCDITEREEHELAYNSLPLPIKAVILIPLSSVSTGSAYWDNDFSSPVFSHDFNFTVHQIFHGNLKMFHTPPCFKKMFFFD